MSKIIGDLNPIDDIDNTKTTEIKSSKSNSKFTVLKKNISGNIKVIIAKFKMALSHNEPANELFGKNSSTSKQKKPTDMKNEAIDAAANYMSSHYDALRKQFDGHNGDYLVIPNNITCNIAMYIKEFLWQHNIPLLAFSMTNKNSDQSYILAILKDGFNYDSNTLYAGFLVLTAGGSNYAKMKGKTGDLAEYGLDYYTVWNATDGATDHYSLVFLGASLRLSLKVPFEYPQP